MKTIVIEATPCPSCGKPMPAGALAGLCPACLLAQGAETDAGDASPNAPFVPPPLEEVAKLFPQLEILGLLGAGGMGAVYKARQPALDRVVALKILPSQNAGGINFAERFNREARALARLSHPNIVAVHEFGQAGGLSFFIMEFVDGANLRQLERAGRLSPREALQIIPQICDALQYAHDESVVHRDIKPENVLVDRKGRVKIADFGLAKIMGQNADSHRLTMEGQVMGTPHYMAPEQVERPLAVDHRADIYALGVVFYEMLTGDLPLGKFPPPSRKFQLDVRLDDVVLRALENDPARRYQQASEVKSQVETIAGTPRPPVIAAVAASPPDERQVRWMGFPIVVEREGKRRVNRKEALKAFGITFGVLTLAFFLVSLFTGRTLLGWLGISGALSLKIRLLASALIVAYGVWRAWHRPAEEARPRTPRGTVVLPPPGLSRKAALGACWAPVFFIAALLWVPAAVTTRGDFADFSLNSTWWQILLAVTVLPLGVTAPFGTTILGWLAVGDIRRAQGRVTGLPLAVFDGLFFLLLAFNGLLVWAWTTSVRSVAEATGNYGFTGPWPAIASVGAAVSCLIATFDISRRVWRAVRRAGGVPPARPPSAARRMAVGLAVVIAVAAGVGAVVTVFTKAGSRKGVVPERFQVAEVDSKTGGLLARLPKRGSVALVAISDEDAPANAWWRPDGVAMADSLLEVEGISKSTNPNLKVRDVVIRWRDLPEGASGPTIEIEPGANSWANGGRVLRDGKELAGGSAIRMGLPLTARTATMRVGFGLALWQTISTHDASGNSSTHTMLPEVPKFNARVHQITEENGKAVVTMIIDREDRDWNMRLVAVDTNSVEHSFHEAASTPLDKASIWTYKFKLARSELKEFQVQVRPTHWIEFRDVALDPRDRGRVGKSKRVFKPTGFSKAKEVQIAELFDFDKGVPGVFPTASDGTKSYAGIERNPSWITKNGFDVDAGTNELRLAQMQIVDVKSDEWETLTPNELIDRMNHGLYGPSRLPSTPGAQPPLTHGFRTRQGNYGLLQIMGFSENWPGVQLRYKLVERAHFE